MNYLSTYIKHLAAAFVMLFSFAATVYAAGGNGLVTLTLADEPLPEVLKKIEQAGGKSICRKAFLVYRAAGLLRGAVQP